MTDTLGGEGVGKAAQGRPPTITDVARCYRLLLGRDLESVVVAGRQIAESPTVMDLVERVWWSEEAVRYRLGEALPRMARDQLSTMSPAPQTVISESDLERLWTETIAAWSRRGLGSYHVWLTRNEPRYAERSVRSNADLIFAAGRDEARELRRICARHGHVFRNVDTIMVLGANADRLAPALAHEFARYVSVDMTPRFSPLAMVEQDDLITIGRQTIDQFRHGRVRYDVAYTVSALQYAPPPVMADIVAKMASDLNPGGMLIFQLPCHLHDYAFDAGSYIAGEGRDVAGELHAIPQSDILALMREHQITPLEIIPDGRVASLGTSFLFIGRKDCGPRPA